MVKKPKARDSEEKKTCDMRKHVKKLKMKFSKKMRNITKLLPFITLQTKNSKFYLTFTSQQVSIKQCTILSPKNITCVLSSQTKTDHSNFEIEAI